MGTGWVSVSLSPLFEKSPPPVGRVPYRLTVPTGQAVATASNEVTSKTTDNGRHAIQPQRATIQPRTARTSYLYIVPHKLHTDDTTHRKSG